MFARILNFVYDIIMKRCNWVNLNNPLYVDYHDNEWGVAVHNDKTLFELLLLESFQAGLSWECVLNKREAFRTAFDNFDVDKIANYKEDKIEKLLNNKDIIRNKLKINASIQNAKVFKAIQQEFKTFDAYLDSFTKGKIFFEEYTLRTTSPLAEKISKDLISRGMKFVGATIIYSYLQAIGVINAHGRECDLHKVKR